MNEEIQDESTSHLSVRIPKPLFDQLEEEIEKRNEAMPGATFKRADVVRMLLTEALAAAEG